MLNNKVIVVIGGSGLLGTKFCEGIADQGGIVVVADIDYDSARELVDNINQQDAQASAQMVDITSERSVSLLIAEVVAEYGQIDGVVNNAYPRVGNYGCKLEKVTYDDFCANMGVHLGGYFLVAQQFAKYFSDEGGGNIVNMGSIYGEIAPRFMVYEGTSMTTPVEYAAIKAGIHQLTRYFAQYYKKQDVRVNTLSPGGIFDSQPQIFIDNYNSLSGNKGMLDSSDVVGALLFLLSDLSKYITGQNIVVDDGFSL